MLLRGIDGSNPLAFLAGIGAFRLMDGLWRERHLRIRWVADGTWRPEVGGLAVTDGQELCNILHGRAEWAPLQQFNSLGDDLTVAREVFDVLIRGLAREADDRDRRAADFAAAFGNEVFEDEKKGRIRFTEFCFITGSGHQHFLGTARGLEQHTGPEHLREALFEAWRYADQGLSMRWDPTDVKEYALRWQDPSIGGASAVWGANRLAFEALPMFPTVPAENGLLTTGFATRNRAAEFTWPIWTEWASADTVRSLMSLRELQSAQPDHIVLQEMGVAAAFRATRVRIGQGRNFKVSFRPARAV
jgi:hypothetical protein